MYLYIYLLHNSYKQVLAAMKFQTVKLTESVVVPETPKKLSQLSLSWARNYVWANALMNRYTSKSSEHVTTRIEYCKSTTPEELKTELQDVLGSDCSEIYFMNNNYKKVKTFYNAKEANALKDEFGVDTSNTNLADAMENAISQNIVVCIDQNLIVCVEMP